jgi:type VI secretion system secreted protein VgrG
VGGSAADVFANTQLLGVKTPLGKDALGLAQFGGVEGLSRLFTYQLDLYAENGVGDVAKALLGHPLSVDLAGRPFNGICSRIAQGESSATHTRYRAEVVPWLWLHGLGRDNRVFATLTVPEIVEQVLAGRPLDLRLQGSYEKWDYVFQRNESDLAFVSRLLEDEGIWYFFAHSEEGHTLVLGDTPEAHPSLPAVQFDEDGERKREQLVHAWERTQELEPGKVTLWDHCFELPHDHLEATATLPEHLRTPATEAAEIYDYPGGYAGRFDGVDAGGGDQPAELQKLFPAAERAAALRMQAEAAGAVTVAGASSVRALAAGGTFELRGRYEGRYLLTSVSHRASRRGDRLRYANTFTCIPDAVPFRPPRATAQPFLGPETAVVTGPPGEEVFTDKYGRVQVKFHWDRSEGQASPWLRVVQPAAGGFSLPEVGDEVLVAFEHGDPDRPYVLGSLWNPGDMPPQERDER